MIRGLTPPGSPVDDSGKRMRLGRSLALPSRQIHKQASRVGGSLILDSVPRSRTISRLVNGAQFALRAVTSDFRVVS
jgi:hypothetical protein